MKKTVVIAVAAVCLLGCKKELHDPLLRQQLTTIVSSLNDEDAAAVKKAGDDIGAILSVNSAKMSKEQKKKLSSAQSDLSGLSGDLAIRDFNKVSGKTMKGILDKDIDSEINGFIKDAKKLISEVAATF